jgi:hypothetical protein
VAIFPDNVRRSPVVPQAHVENDLVVARIEVMTMGRPARSEAMNFDIPSLAYAIVKGEHSVLKIGSRLPIPPSRRVYRHGSTIQRPQYGRPPTRIEP